MLIVGVVGSPNAGGRTRVAVDAVLGGAVAEGAEVRVHELAAAVPRDGAGPQVPADLLGDDGLPVKGLAGLLTVLHDGGYDDREIIAWLHLDAGLPGRPIDALRENRGSEVMRRAQAMAL